jgi:hypothetical protein
MSHRGHSVDRQTMIAFAVNVGNLGRRHRPRLIMSELVPRLNATLCSESDLVRVLDFFGHTGNFVLACETTPDKAAQRLAGLLQTPCTVVAVETVQSCAAAARSFAPPTAKLGIQWTPGAVFRVSGPEASTAPRAPNAVFRGLNGAMLLAWKEDQLDAQGRLDKDRRSGGWGALSSAVTAELGGVWTARSISTLEGVLMRAEGR